MSTMIPPHTYAAGRSAEERAKDTLRYGEHAHLLRMAKPAKVGLLDRLFTRVGRLLASTGEKLREPCELVLATTGECPWPEPSTQCC